MEYEQIWAPWRLAYIVGDDKPLEKAAPLPVPQGGDPDCFLCQSVPAGDDLRRLVVQRGGVTMTILNRYPYNNGHLLVAPMRHVARLDQLNAGEHMELSQTITRMAGLLETVLKPEGFNVGLNLGRVAGAGVPGHLHWHIVPRWGGDTNFMPVVAGVRVIPQSLDALWGILRGELGRQTAD